MCSTIFYFMSIFACILLIEVCVPFHFVQYILGNVNRVQETAIFAGGLLFLLGIFGQDMLSAFHIILGGEKKVETNSVIKAPTITSS